MDGKTTNASSSQSRAVDGAALLKVARAARDEVIDIFDSICYAETNQERFENICDIAGRHKGTLGVMSAIVIAKTLLVSNNDISLGAKAIGELRKKEMQKWGTRLVK